MNPVGVFVGLSVVAIVVYFIINAANKGGVSEPFGRQVLYQNVRTGEMRMVQTNIFTPKYWQPNVNPNTGKVEIPLIVKRFMSESTEVRKLSDFYEIVRYESYTKVYDETDYFSSIGASKIIDLTADKIELLNKVSTKNARIIELENLMDDYIDRKLIPRHKEMKEASQPIVLPKKTQR